MCVCVYSSTAYLLGYHRSFHDYAVVLRLNAKRSRFQPAPTVEWKRQCETIEGASVATGCMENAILI